jgi:cysteine sulfinate desulfinase/cysteine desulfurase-like protein
VAARVLEVGERDDACRAATERYGAAVGLVDALNEARFNADARRDQAERLARRARRALARHRDASAEAEVADRLSHLWTRS